MSALAEKLRKARTLKVEVDGFTFYVLRPTPLEFNEKLRGENSARGMLTLVIGWDGVSELSMFDGGAPHPLPFDPVACAEWLSDRPDLFKAVSSAVVEGYEAYLQKQEGELKN
jgi:hypothetical protein